MFIRYLRTILLLLCVNSALLPATRTESKEEARPKSPTDAVGQLQYAHNI